jgi:hypothetical protein
MNDARFTWIARTANTKTGDIPGAYVGQTIEECRESCHGCPLLNGACYAWSGFTYVSFTKIVERRLTSPAKYTVLAALRDRSPRARAVRFGVMGDPSRVNRDELKVAVAACRGQNLDLIGYTHFWREPENSDLKGIFMASCEDEEGAAEARAFGWTPTLVLPWDHALRNGPTFTLPNGERGVVCPAQTKKEITCNDCRMCSLDHPVWKAGKISAIGFLDHSKKASREKARWQRGLQLPIFGAAPDTRTKRRRKVAKVTSREGVCPQCGRRFKRAALGRPKIYCRTSCRMRAAFEKRKVASAARAS